MRIERLGDLGTAAEVLRARRRRGAARARAAAAGRADRRLVRLGGGDRPECRGAAGRPGRGVRGAAGRGAATRSAAAGSAICPIPTPAPTAGRGSPRPPAAGPTACCAWTATAAGGTKAFPAHRSPAGWPRRWSSPAAGRDLRNRLGSSRFRPATAPVCWPAWTAIGAGEVYQACVCTQFTGTVTRLAAGLLRRRGGRAPRRPGRPTWPATGARSRRCHRSCSCAASATRSTSSPIKGTLPLHAAPAELRASAKDVAENIMIVDLVRNDLGRVARDRLGDRPRTAGRATRARGVASGVDGVGASARRSADRRHCWPRRSRRHRSPAHRKPAPGNCFRSGSRAGAGCTAAPSGMASPVAGCELNVAIRTVEFDAARRARCSASAAGSPPTPIRSPSGRNACTRPPPIVGASRGSGRRAAQHRVVELAPRRRAGMRVDHPRAGVLDPHPVVDQRARPRRPAIGRSATGCAPASTTVISPSTPSSAHSASSASDPRRISSCTFVSSRHTTARRSPPSSSTASRRHSASRRGDSKNTTVRGSAAKPGQPGPARGLLARREPLEAEPVRRQAGDGQRGGDRRRAGQAAHRQARLDARRHQPVAGIVDQRHTGVADHQHGRAGLDVVDAGRAPGPPRSGRTG